MKFYGVKMSKNGNELLEVVDAVNEKEARKMLCIKYMRLALSCDSLLDVLKKSEYEKLMAC